MTTVWNTRMLFSTGKMLTKIIVRRLQRRVTKLKEETTGRAKKQKLQNVINQLSTANTKILNKSDPLVVNKADEIIKKLDEKNTQVFDTDALRLKQFLDWGGEHSQALAAILLEYEDWRLR